MWTISPVASYLSLQGKVGPDEQKKRFCQNTKSRDLHHDSRIHGFKALIMNPGWWYFPEGPVSKSAPFDWTVHWAWPAIFLNHTINICGGNVFVFGCICPERVLFSLPSSKDIRQQCPLFTLVVCKVSSVLWSSTTIISKMIGGILLPTKALNRALFVGIHFGGYHHRKSFVFKLHLSFTGDGFMDNIKWPLSLLSINCWNRYAKKRSCHRDKDSKKVVPKQLWYRWKWLTIICLFPHGFALRRKGHKFSIALIRSLTSWLLPNSR